MIKKPLILITTGDPKGIGKEVTAKSLKDPRIKGLADFIVIDPSDATGLSAIKKALSILKLGKAQALVTAPVNKSKINNSGTLFQGHTEFLAKSTNTKRFAMFFCSEKLKVTTVTRHIPLKDVPKAIRKKRTVEDAILLTHKALKENFRISKPRIGVAGLNPHAGEMGTVGLEEKEILEPLLKKLRSKNLDLKGPLPGDVVFHLAYTGKLDVVIAMYHDQALAPFKMIAFKDGVNVTLGLPFIRTSPDHGTAYDIAGKGIADPSSMKEAIKLAAYMCKDSKHA
ncbi:MAG: 4-hydroxythreonine-4-phosphate dehydrogenase PdxA [Candidatus Omnitrophota bacterium]